MSRIKKFGLTIVCALSLGCSQEKPAPNPAPTVPHPLAVKSAAVAPKPSIFLQEVSPAAYHELIAKQRGKVVLVDFWATWCPACLEQFPHTIEAARKYGDRGFVALTMSFDELAEKPKVIDFLNRKNAQIMNLICTLDGSTPEQMEAYEITNKALPHYKVYDRQGTLRKSYSGNPNSQGLEELLEQLLAEAVP